MLAVLLKYWFAFTIGPPPGKWVEWLIWRNCHNWFVSVQIKWAPRCRACDSRKKTRLIFYPTAAIIKACKHMICFWFLAKDFVKRSNNVFVGHYIQSLIFYILRQVNLLDGSVEPFTFLWFLTTNAAKHNNAITITSSDECTHSSCKLSASSCQRLIKLIDRMDKIG